MKILYWFEGLYLIVRRVFQKFPPDMRVECCSCKKHLWGRRDAPQPSHGYCIKCYVAEMVKLEKLKKGEL
jgi:hypothetical protein